MFPDLFNIATDKEALVSSYMGMSERGVTWNPIFVRAVQDWELNSVDVLFDLFHSALVGRGDEDKMCQGLNKNQLFDVQSYYLAVRGPTGRMVPWKTFWQAKYQVAFFVWSAVLGKILTVENLIKRRMIIVDWCCMYKTSASQWTISFFIAR